MLKRIRHNFSLKILSVILAAFTWVLVYNSNNPVETRNYDVDIIFLNEASLASNNLKITNEYNRQVTVQVRGRRSNLDQVLLRDFRAIADLSNITSERVEYITVDYVQYTGDKNITYKIKADERINVNVEKIITGDFPIKIEVIGQPEERYSIIDISVKPENYSIKETNTLINRIDHAVVKVDVEGIRGNRTRRLYTEIYDRNGRVINELSNSFIVDVTIVVAKEVYVDPILTGALTADYVVVNKTAIPEKILISGPADELTKIDIIRTEPISISNQTDVFTKSAKLTDIPPNSRVVGRSDSVDVSVYIEKLEERTFVFSKNEIENRYADSSGNYSYYISENSVSFVLKGRRRDIIEIEKSDLAPYIDVSGLKDESRILPVRITVPENTQQINYPSVEVSVYRNVNISFDTSSITLSSMRTNMFDYRINQQGFLLKVQGYSDNLNEIDKAKLNPRVNVGQLGAGTHSMEVEVTLPDGVRKYGQNTIEIIVTSK